MVQEAGDPQEAVQLQQTALVTEYVDERVRGSLNLPLLQRKPLVMASIGQVRSNAQMLSGSMGSEIVCVRRVGSAQGVVPGIISALSVQLSFGNTVPR